MEWLLEEFTVAPPYFFAKAALRLLLSAAFGAFIGYEREHSNHPAGLRTHALVCLGAALVMTLSEYLSYYYGLTDPTRMGAQVISGIGFLGAGAIIKEGFTVRGLTTAATLWAVACVGLAVGSGFYVGALMTTALIYITLNIVKRVAVHGEHDGGSGETEHTEDGNGDEADAEGE